MSPVYVFSALSLTMWAAILVWSLSQRKDRWYHVWVLVLATLTWWLGECVAIRLGKYQYADFPGWLVLPFGGAPSQSDPLASSLAQLHAWLKLPRVEGCMPAQASWNIPFPIIAVEACLVVAFLRLSFLRLLNKGFGPACAAGCFSAVLMVTLAGILDPVVSTTQWCGVPGNNPLREGLHHVALWHWFTDEHYTGYWFGVPMVNYLSWFVGMWAFSFLARLDDDGPSGIVHRYDRWWKYVLAGAATLALVFIIEFPLKIVSDLALVRGREVFPVASKSAWEFGVVGLLLVLNLFVIWWFGQPHPNLRKARWVGVVPPFAVSALCFVYVAMEPQLELFAVWILSLAVTVIVAFRPGIVTGLLRKPRPQPPAETARV